MNSLWHFLVTDAKPVFWLGIFGAVFTWIGKIISDRASIKANAAVQKEMEQLKSLYTTATENLRADAIERQELVKSVSAAVSSNYAASHERRLQAIEAMWDAVLQMYQLTLKNLGVYTIIPRAEFQGQHNEKIWQLLPAVTHKDWGTEFLSLGTDVERHRPFLGEDLWQLFYVYRAFSGRQVLILTLSEKNKRIPGWDQDYSDDGGFKKDVATLSLLHLVFSQKELDTIISAAQPFEATNGIIVALQERILNKVNERLFGKQLIQTSLEERQRLYQSLEVQRRL